jgi:hypothetical protein
MNVMAFIAGVTGAFYGGIAVWLVALRKRRWAAAGQVAFGAVLLIMMATEGNRSRAEHNVVWLASCVLWAFFLVCVAIDARSRRIAKLPAAQER